MTAVRAGTAPDSLRRRFDRRGFLLIAQVLAGLGLATVWQLAAQLNSQVPGVLDVARSLFEALGEGTTWTAVGQTLSTWLVGLVLSIIIGVSVGFLVAASDFGFRSSQFVIDFMRSIPPVALLPVALLIFGTRPIMVVVLVLFACVWIMVIQAVYGLRDVDNTAKETFRSYRMRRRDRLRFLTLPSAMPYLMAGVRVAATMALLIVIGAELVTSAPGLGAEILRAGAGGASSRLFALAFLAGLLGLLVHLSTTALERSATRWKPSTKGVS